MTARGLIDTHCHLALLEERGLLGAALESAAERGVEQIVTVGLDVDDSDRNRSLAERLPGVWFTVGWHPHRPAPPDARELAALGELLDHPRAVAVGEIGLDFYWRAGYHETPADVQRRQLAVMLELAAHHRKPIVVHDRDAHEATLAALESWPALRSCGGVMHCFSGDAAMARRCLDLGLRCSFAGTITFRRSEDVQAALRGLHGGEYVVETDAPFLAPVPHRGRPNLPGYVADTVTAAARLRGEEVSTVAADTAAAARRLFALPAGGDDPLRQGSR